MSSDSIIDPFAPFREVKTQAEFETYVLQTANRLQISAWAYQVLCDNIREDERAELTLFGLELMRQTAWAMQHLQDAADRLSFGRHAASGKGEGGRHG